MLRSERSEIFCFRHLLSILARPQYATGLKHRCLGAHTASLEGCTETTKTTPSVTEKYHQSIYSQLMLTHVSTVNTAVTRYLATSSNYSCHRLRPSRVLASLPWHLSASSRGAGPERSSPGMQKRLGNQRKLWKNNKRLKQPVHKHSQTPIPQNECKNFEMGSKQSCDLLAQIFCRS